VIFHKATKECFQENSDDLLLANNCFYSFSDKKVVLFTVRSAQKTKRCRRSPGCKTCFYLFPDNKGNAVYHPVYSKHKKVQTISWLQSLFLFVPGYYRQCCSPSGLLKKQKGA